MSYEKTQSSCLEQLMINDENVLKIFNTIIQYDLLDYLQNYQICQETSKY